MASFFSALIITYNDTEALLTCANSIIETKYCNQIVIYNNAGYQDQSDILTRISDICDSKNIALEYHKSHYDAPLSTAYNYGLSQAKNHFVLIINADCYIAKPSQWHNIDILIHNGVSIVGFPIYKDKQLEGIVPIHSIEGGRPDHNSFQQNASKFLSTPIQSGPIPDVMPQAFFMPVTDHRFDTNLWYTFETLDLLKRQNSHAWLCADISISHSGSEIYHSRNATSHTWKKRTSSSVSYFAQKHRFYPKIFLEMHLITHFQLPFFRVPRQCISLKNGLWQFSTFGGIVFFIIYSNTSIVTRLALAISLGVTIYGILFSFFLYASHQKIKNIKK